MKMWDIREGKPYLQQFSDEDRYDYPPKTRHEKREYIIPFIQANKDTSLKGLDDRLREADTVFTKPKDYYNRHKNIDGIIVTNNSLLYKIAIELNHTVILYDRNPSGDKNAD